jgi:hypothetical protein
VRLQQPGGAPQHMQLKALHIHLDDLLWGKSLNLSLKI